MLLNKDSFKVNGISWAKYLTEIEFGYYKIWSKDTGRNQNASYKGTIKGIFPKFTLHFKPLTKTELEAVAQEIDKQYQSVTYYDPNKKANKTIDTYAGDWAVRNKGLIETHGVKNDPFSISLIATDPRS